MAEEPHDKDGAGARKPDPRTDRLRAALRENLRRRKEQARGRGERRPEAESGGEDDLQRPNSARIPDDEA